MGANLSKYPDYKNSEIQWLGEVPAHWKIIRSGTLFREVVDTGYPDLDLLSIDRFRGIIYQTEIGRKTRASEDRSLYKRIRPGELGYNLMNAFMGSIGVSQYEGLLSPAYAVAVARLKVNPWYYHHLYRTPIYSAEINRCSYGIMYERNRLYFDRFKTIPIPLPPIEEQERIVAFIHNRTSQIQRLIRNKRRLIALLTEQKQNVIDRYVTVGIDSTIRLKPSGVDELEDVPTHWNIKPLKRWVKINSSSLSETTDPNYTFKYIDIGSVGTGFLIEKPESMRFSAAPSRARRILRKGDTVISTVRTYLKAVYFVEDDCQDLIASTGFAVLTPGRDVVPEFLSFLIQSNSFIERVTTNSIGVAYPAITETRLGVFHLALPPTEMEQLEIINCIKTETQAIEVAIKRTQREIDLIREYNTRLIVDAVTGKLDVRNIQLINDKEPSEMLNEHLSSYPLEGEGLESIEEDINAND
jgi:type I restriction enzyme, S subunit